MCTVLIARASGRRDLAPVPDTDGNGRPHAKLICKDKRRFMASMTKQRAQKITTMLQTRTPLAIAILFMIRMDAQTTSDQITSRTLRHLIQYPRLFRREVVTLKQCQKLAGQLATDVKRLLYRAIACLEGNDSITARSSGDPNRDRDLMRTVQESIITRSQEPDFNPRLVVMDKEGLVLDARDIDRGGGLGVHCGSPSDSMTKKLGISLRGVDGGAACTATTESVQEFLKNMKSLEYAGPDFFDDGTDSKKPMHMINKIAETFGRDAHSVRNALVQQFRMRPLKGQAEHHMLCIAHAMLGNTISARVHVVVGAESISEGKVIYAPGSGRSIEIRVLEKLFGDFQIAYSSSDLAKGPGASAPNPTLANTEGKRLICADDLEKLEGFSTELLCTLITGNGSASSFLARMLYANPKDKALRALVCMLIISSNSPSVLAALSSGAHGVMRRLLIDKLGCLFVETDTITELLGLAKSDKKPLFPDRDPNPDRIKSDRDREIVSALVKQNRDAGLQGQALARGIYEREGNNADDVADKARGLGLFLMRWMREAPTKMHKKIDVPECVVQAKNIWEKQCRTARNATADAASGHFVILNEGINFNPPQMGWKVPVALAQSYIDAFCATVAIPDAGTAAQAAFHKGVPASVVTRALQKDMPLVNQLKQINIQALEPDDDKTSNKRRCVKLDISKAATALNLAKACIDSLGPVDVPDDATDAQKARLEKKRALWEAIEKSTMADYHGTIGDKGARFRPLWGDDRNHVSLFGRGKYKYKYKNVYDGLCPALGVDCSVAFDGSCGVIAS
jgi:hypothetical protein